MPFPKTLNPELVRTQLEKILSSAGFARNDRLSGFLRFLVEHELVGRAGELKESVIGVEFPAVNVPDPEKSNDGRSLASFSRLVSVRMLLSWERPR